MPKYSDLRRSLEPTNWWRIVWRVIRIPIVAYLGFLLLAMLYEEKMIFFPQKYPHGEWDVAVDGLEDVFVTAADGTQCHAWYLPHDDPVGLVLFLHGNAGNIAGRAPFMLQMNRDVGVSIMMLDYRGYGRSDGSPNEAGIIQDAKAARAWLAEREEVNVSDVVLMGRSLGGAVAVDLAADGGAKALILQSTFTSMPDVAAVHYPFLPVRLLMGTRLDSVAKIKNYDGPLLMSHGDTDEVMPYSLGQELFAASPSSGKQFITLSGGYHNDPNEAAYLHALREFLMAHCPP